ncbi:uroporphyrinogen-III synthase [Streptomyces sp. BI20]|uniref:uroporphyrinogen-III synthase n=1 Tax=Streptomyces sp. BI20 TaxID=3403460 RepID=UPI003C71166E
MSTRTPDRPLCGFTVGVTAARRREELTALLVRRGARVIEAPSLRILPLDDDAALRTATERCLAAPLDYAVATTGVGWRGWLSAADGWGHGPALHHTLTRARILSRGPKATGAVRATGLDETWAPPSEGIDELLARLLAEGVTGRRVAVQEHGAPLPGLTTALRERGAHVIEVPVYRWAPPEDPHAVRRLAELTTRGEVHALTFTSAPAVTAFLDAADAAGHYPEILTRLTDGTTLPVCVGEVCARPLARLGVPALVPERGRLGALVRILTDTLPERGRHRFTTPDGTLTLQGNALLVDPEPLWLPPLSAAVLRALAEHPGRVLSRAELLRRVWTPRPGTRPDEHAVETAVARLRAALGPHAPLVRTVPKRGYRLTAEPPR